MQSIIASHKVNDCNVNKKTRMNHNFNNNVFYSTSSLIASNKVSDCCGNVLFSVFLHTGCVKEGMWRSCPRMHPAFTSHRHLLLIATNTTVFMSLTAGVL